MENYKSYINNDKDHYTISDLILGGHDFIIFKVS